MMSEQPGSPPTDVALTLHIATYHLRRRDLAAAEATLNPLREMPLGPNDRKATASAYAQLAQTYATRRDADHAREALAQAHALAEGAGGGDIWRAEAALAALEGDQVGAIAAWRRVAGEEESGAAWLALARAYEAAGLSAKAVAAYLQAARLGGSHATTLTVAERLAALDGAPAEDAAVRSVRIALVGSATLEHLAAYLRVHCRLAGVRAALYVAPYGQYAQEIHDPASGLYAFQPEVIVLAIHGRALFPDLYDDPFALEPAERRQAAEEVVASVDGLLATLTERCSALVLLHTFATPQYSPLGMLDARDPFGQSALFQAVNDGLAQRVRERYPAVRLVDEERVFGRIGKARVTEPRLWFLARLGWDGPALTALAGEYLRAIKPLLGLSRKCIVLDLDNTLWGGVIGEDGIAGIAIGHEAPGNAYLAFQAALLTLWRRGILLAIASKNDEATALAALEGHPDMLLRPHHFAAMRINWQEKADNLRSLAEELNIGLDSMVFLDDNPTERLKMRARLPEVLTVELPRDPALYRAALLALTDLDSLGVTEEDRDRARLYAERRERGEWAAQHATNLDDYLAGLKLVVTVAPADEIALPRVAQLLGKTNQFNLTTRRHSEAIVRALASAADAAVFTARVADRFGDSGLVGVAIVRKRGKIWEIDSLLLSCRVLGCGVETALLAALAIAARGEGARRLRGTFIPTAKNAPARDFYARHGFTRVEMDGDAAGSEEHWAADLEEQPISPPAWLTLRLGDARAEELALPPRSHLAEAD